MITIQASHTSPPPPFPPARSHWETWTQQFLDPARPFSPRSSQCSPSSLSLLSPDLTWIPWSLVKVTPSHAPQLPSTFSLAQFPPDETRLCLLHTCTWQLDVAGDTVHLPNNEPWPRRALIPLVCCLSPPRQPCTPAPLLTPPYLHLQPITLLPT